MISLQWFDGLDIRTEMWLNTLTAANEYICWYNRENPGSNMKVIIA